MIKFDIRVTTAHGVIKYSGLFSHSIDAVNDAVMRFGFGNKFRVEVAK